jgi:site-specific recombinase XerD
MTIQEAIDRYLKQIKRAKSQHTVEAYGRALQLFGDCMAADNLEFSVIDVSELSPLWLEPFLNHLRKRAVSTEHLYTTAVAGFYRYVAAQDWAALNLATLDFELSQRRNQGQRLHIFPESNLEKLLVYMEQLAAQQPVEVPAAKNTAAILTIQRDVALLLTLADTGLRVSEACSLRRGDLDWDHQRAVIIGKGDKQAIVRFSVRALEYIRRYLKTRAELDRPQGRQNVLPLFARHDKRAGQRILPISSRTAENIVADYVLKALGEEARGSITPHTFRHYFVTRAARQHNILLAQHLARHESINTTSGYTHLTDTEIDQAYTAVFDNIPVEEQRLPREDDHET